MLCQRRSSTVRQHCSEQRSVGVEARTVGRPLPLAEEVSRNLTDLKAIGVSLAIDDYGTMSSSPSAQRTASGRAVLVSGKERKRRSRCSRGSTERAPDFVRNRPFMDNRCPLADFACG